MNYSALIQNRKSVREFTDKKVSAAALAEIEAYYQQPRSMSVSFRTRSSIT